MEGGMEAGVLQTCLSLQSRLKEGEKRKVFESSAPCLEVFRRRSLDQRTVLGPSNPDQNWFSIQQLVKPWVSSCPVSQSAFAKYGTITHKGSFIKFPQEWLYSLPIYPRVFFCLKLQPHFLESHEWKTMNIYFRKNLCYVATFVDFLNKAKVLSKVW